MDLGCSSPPTPRRNEVAVEDHGKVDESGVQVLDAAKRVGQLQGHGVCPRGCLVLVRRPGFRRQRPVAPGGRNGVAQAVDTGLDAVIRPAVQDS